MNDNQRQWTPVSERLPANGVAVLWHDANDDIWPTYVGKRQGNTIDHGGDLNQPLKTGPTHWRPLPELPGFAAETATQPSLTDAERQAIEWCIEQWAGVNRSTTLRKLLERL